MRAILRKPHLIVPKQPGPAHEPQPAVPRYTASPVPLRPASRGGCMTPLVPIGGYHTSLKSVPHDASMSRRPPRTQTRVVERDAGVHASPSPRRGCGRARPLDPVARVPDITLIVPVIAAEQPDPTVAHHAGMPHPGAPCRVVRKQNPANSILRFPNGLPARLGLIVRTSDCVNLVLENDECAVAAGEIPFDAAFFQICRRRNTSSRRDGRVSIVCCVGLPRKRNSRAPSRPVM